MYSRCLIVVALGLGFFSWHNAAGQEKTDADRIQGSWKLIKGESEGKPSPPPAFLEKDKFVFKGNKVFIFEHDKLTEEGTFVLDAANKPPTIDFTATDKPSKAKVTYGIYRIEGDTLTICVGVKRPTEFKGAGKAALLTFQRVKSIK